VAPKINMQFKMGLEEPDKSVYKSTFFKWPKRTMEDYFTSTSK
jgi:hypothetical protein